MEPQNNNTLTEQLKQLISAGDEAKVRAFLVENFQSFPEDLQREISLVLLDEGLDKAIDSKLKEYERKSSSALKMCNLIKEELAKAEKE